MPATAAAIEVHDARCAACRGAAPEDATMRRAAERLLAEASTQTETLRATADAWLLAAALLWSAGSEHGRSAPAPTVRGMQ